MQSPESDKRDSTSAAELDARYGRTPAAARRTKWVVATSGIAFVIVFVAWLVWGGLLGTPARFETRDTGFQLIGDEAVSVRWQFTVDSGTEARCAVHALNSTFKIVGWKIVEIPASSVRIRSLSETVLTTEQAVTGLIYRCWLT